ncbi:GmrSD restriction endonuclease domain-containing protein [Avibacterium paragallinarum]|uniref:GmrSD restriction endonuclease domain-containing protein n=1 Tax=Avibacterium paragallinarum TaxID=728 RepID=UPI0039782D37
MAVTRYSFIDIFDRTFEIDQKDIQLKKIIIPIIQRDYAQGRKTTEIRRIRNQFLDSLYKAITEKPITLDFVYGDIDDEGNLTPLDGQQRLTTLFLLHWYAAKKSDIPESDYDFLKKFSYETRYSARYFCGELINHRPKFTTPISEDIINQAWFPFDWENDPTISSMLVMLDAIDDKFKNIPDLWGKLQEKCITFYFLPIKNMGLTDDLYIKMNSRGKPLTLFEHFKAELEREIRKEDEDLADRIMCKIDGDWTDLLWLYCNGDSGSSDNIIDNKFLCYFRFICDVICYRQNESPRSKSNDEFDLLQQYFSSKSSNVVSNIKTMERFFDCWCNIPQYETPTDFLMSFMTQKEKDESKYESGKILVRSDFTNIFEDCLQASNKNFPLNKALLLYAITLYLQNINEITERDFKRRIRIVNNLIQNSEDEISDRADRNRIPAILLQIDSIILSGVIDDSIESNFNTHQLLEEKEKTTFLRNHPEKEEVLFKLEDHYLLNGQISILGLENLAYADLFESLFHCDFDCIDCAMMAIGDYGQPERNKWRYQYGSASHLTAWRNLFHKSANAGFDNTKNILISLLKNKDVTDKKFTDDALKDIAKNYLEICEKESLYPFRYYYIKYSDFRPKSYGKMYNDSAKENPYMFLVMQTENRWSKNSYCPYLKAASEAHLSSDGGQSLILNDKYIICNNNSYEIKENDSDTLVDTLTIPQDNNGIDTKDRIILLKDYIESKMKPE